MESQTPYQAPDKKDPRMIYFKDVKYRRYNILNRIFRHHAHYNKKRHNEEDKEKGYTGE